MIEVSTYKPFPKQQEFHRSPAKYRLFGGAAGPGKSTALMWEAVIQALETPGVDTLLLRKTYPELEKSIVLPFRRDVPWDAMGAKFNESKHTVYWPNGSTTQFGYCANDNDVTQYQGGEYLFIGLDELTMFSYYVWQYLTSRNRCRVPGTFPNMAGASNPGNIGHQWVKALWIEKRMPAGAERTERYNQADYDFIRATLDDNPIYANDANYIASLDALPTQLYKAFRLGEWDIFAGQYFDCFDATRHVVPMQTLELKPWWPRWISGDWGYSHPAAFYWHAKKDTGEIVTYRELHGSGIGERELGERIVEMSKGEKIGQIFLGPDAFAKRGSAHTVAEQIGDELSRARLPRPAPADNDRVGGARLMYQLLAADQWSISSACSSLIECLPTLIHDEKNIEDVLKVDQAEGSLGDDAYDACRYGLKSMLAPGRKPLEMRVNERIDAAKITDPTSAMIWRQRFALQEKQQAGAVIRHAGRFARGRFN